MTEKQTLVVMANIETKILPIRGQKVILDADLAELYGVATKVLNQVIFVSMSTKRSSIMG